MLLRTIAEKFREAFLSDAVKLSPTAKEVSVTETNGEGPVSPSNARPPNNASAPASYCADACALGCALPELHRYFALYSRRKRCDGGGVDR